MRYEVQPDATLKNGTIFFDMTSAAGEDAFDGMKVDREGNVYVPRCLPVAEMIQSPPGPETDPHNMAWGDEDGKTLRCGGIRGGISAADRDIRTNAPAATLRSTASGGRQGGDMVRRSVTATLDRLVERLNPTAQLEIAEIKLLRDDCTLIILEAGVPR